MMVPGAAYDHIILSVVSSLSPRTRRITGITLSNSDLHSSKCSLGHRVRARQIEESLRRGFSDVRSAYAGPLRKPSEVRIQKRGAALRARD